MRTNLTAAAFIAALTAFSAAAKAGLVGDTVTGHYIFPNSGNSVQDFGPAVVSAGVEYSRIQYNLFADFTDTGLTLSFDPAGRWGAVAQSGPEFMDLTHAFTSVSIDAATTASWFTAGMVSLDNSGTLLINWSGQSFITSDIIVLDLGTGAIPEPLPITLLGVGLFGLAAARRWQV